MTPFLLRKKDDFFADRPFGKKGKELCECVQVDFPQKINQEKEKKGN